MLSLLKNKIRNKFLQTDYIHPYIIWCIDVFLSVISSFSIFLFFHYLINISIHFNQQRYILLIAVISSIVWTGICKTYEGIIRYSTLVELTPVDTCHNCGYKGVIFDKCPVCQSESILRMRRITGYLTGDLSSWNSAKLAEEQDRVKHL